MLRTLESLLTFKQNAPLDEVPIRALERGITRKGYHKKRRGLEDIYQFLREIEAAALSCPLHMLPFSRLLSASSITNMQNLHRPLPDTELPPCLSCAPSQRTPSKRFFFLPCSPATRLKSFYPPSTPKGSSIFGSAQSPDSFVTTETLRREMGCMSRRMLE